MAPFLILQVGQDEEVARRAAKTLRHALQREGVDFRLLHNVSRNRERSLIRFGSRFIKFHHQDHSDRHGNPEADTG
jgi:hypothetical protein